MSDYFGGLSISTRAKRLRERLPVAVVAAVVLLGAGPVTATEVPLIEHAIDGSFDGAESVYTADVDGDGDIDLLGAAGADDCIAWWENPGGAATTDGTPWMEHTIDGSFQGAASVYAADVDGDGDTDILGAASIDDDITWWENPGGAATTDGTPWVEHTIDGSFNGARSVYAADVDGDGDIDVLSCGAPRITWWENPGGSATTDGTTWTRHTVENGFGGNEVYAADGDGDTDIAAAIGNVVDEIIWWENRGGQFGLPTAETAGGFAQVGALSEVLKITGVHEGRMGDNPAELVTFDLLLEETMGDPLSDSEANALLDSLRIYRDDETGLGAGSFQEGEDFQVASINPLSLAAGVQTVSFVDGDMDVEVEFGTDRCYFVVVEAAAGSPIESFLITHLTESTSTGEDADFDIPLRLAYTPATSAAVTLNEAPEADAGQDQLLQVTGGGTADVTLDGSGSSDPDSDLLTYTWTGPFPEGGGTVMGVGPMVTLGAGVHVVTLTVDDGKGGMDSDTVQIEVAEAGACPSDLVLTDVLLLGTQTLEASASATLGPNVVVNGTDIVVNAPVVTINGDTAIGGSFTVGTSPLCL